ncbi:MAG: 50S ribosomal protein L21 [Flavobacteriales bacterium]|jgi:large subunit ribosomal protein L21|nr:50S ribosomal protein L21 [Flavobacteriales bacterium]MBQ1968713.1 50S ribosomal protein L21 [Flavobacteriales bacterium]MBQ5815013.1 50S ribosomal protein L21 [Flavobacteriales bacterium]MBR4402313.1 50S ribosomal protein L21 [Flavobacteriales bacterium]
MFAIVEIAGFQYKVQKDRYIYVNRLKGEVEDKITFDKVLLLSTDTDVKVGTPTVSGAKVEATILEHLRGEKVIVFKKKRRKGYQVQNGHRQYLTKILISDIIA